VPSAGAQGIGLVGHVAHQGSHPDQLPRDQIAALDAWRAEEAGSVTRPEAMRRLMVLALQRLGRFPD
jgi:hypothetical protein